MTYSLAGAFAPVRNSMKIVGNFYDHAGFVTMRFFIDGRLMDINEDRLRSPVLKKAARFYNEANDIFQDKMLKNISDTFAASNFGPKPDFKKPILSLGNVVLSNLGRMSVGQIAFLTLGTSIALVAAHLGSSAHIGTMMSPDTLSTYLAVKPSGSPEPTPQNF